jgi:hypothetical protein
MGTLQRFDLSKIVPRHGLRAYVETGCGQGDSLMHAARCPEFEALLACEIEPVIAIAAIARLAADRRVMVSRSNSAWFLRALPASLPPALIFLDAHFPGADYGLGAHEDRAAPEALRLPLREELEILRARRNGRDVIIVDDLRLYESGDWEQGPCPEGIADPRPNGADWMRALFADTHNAKTLAADTGYLILAPK